MVDHKGFKSSGDDKFPENLVRLEPNNVDKDESSLKNKQLKKKRSEKNMHRVNKNSSQKNEDSKLPVITKIQSQKKKGRYNIFLDEEYAFPVDEALIVKHLLRKGMEVSSEFQQILQTEDTFRKAYQRSLNYLSYGLRSEKEVRDDLIEKEFEEYVFDVIQKLKEQRLINDLEYAKSYVRTAANLNRKGPRTIQNELKQRGIDELKIEEAMPEYPFEDQMENAVKLAEKQWAKTKRQSQRETLQKVKQFLMQKGFSTDVINIAVETIDTEKEADEEYDALVLQGEKAWGRYARKAEGYELIQKTKAYLFNKGYPSELIQRFIDQKEEEV